MFLTCREWRGGQVEGVAERCACSVIVERLLTDCKLLMHGSLFELIAVVAIP